MKTQARTDARAARVSLCGLAAALGLLLGLNGAVLAGPGLTGDPTVDPVPTLDHAQGGWAVVVALDFTGLSTAQLDSVRVVPGPARGHVGEAPMLRAELRGLGGGLLEEFHAWHPLRVLTFDASGLDHMSVLPQATGNITFALRPDLVTLDVIRVEGEQSLVSVDLVGELHDFCRLNPGDPDCVGIVNRPPVCDADGPYSVECAGSSTDVGLDGSGSSDPDDDPLTYAWSGSFAGGSASGVTPTVQVEGFGQLPVQLTVADDFGDSATCSAQVTVADTTPPSIACNAPTTITPADVPITFAATTSDICTGDVSAVVEAFDCFMFTKKGRRIDKTESCAVTFAGEGITIVDSGGVGDRITWRVTASDVSGNQATADCAIVVIKPPDAS